jgi:anti-sigma factor RsiW
MTFDKERQVIEELLPWYATGRLPQREHDRVAAYLLRHPEVEAGLLAAREEAVVATAANEALAGPSPGSLDRLLRSLPVQPQRAYDAPSWLERLADWVASLTPSQLGMAAAALTAVFLAQAVTIGTLIGYRPSVYETATGPNEQSPATAVDLLIGFKPEATMADISAFLKENGLTLIDGPRAGLYRARATGATTAPQLAERLKSAAVVATILPGR